jgi:hypothetical protein
MLWLLVLSMLPSLVHSQFSFMTNNAQITITGDTNIPISGAVVIPSTINGLSVASIGPAAFADNGSLITVTIPSSVTSIGFSAFDGCPNLANVTVGNSVTNIVSFPFYNCPSLTGIYFRGNEPTYTFGVSPPGHAIIYYLPGTTGWTPTFCLLTTAFWLPQLQINAINHGFQANQFEFNITWASGQTVVVESCTNLANPVWSPLETNILIGSSTNFSDLAWTNYASRFYRLSSQ